MFCRFCGNPSDSPVCPACASMVEAAQPAETPVETPVEEATTAPVEAATEAAVETPAEEVPLMELGLEETPKKKKSKKPLWITLTAVVSVLAILVVLFWSTIAGWWWYLTTPAEEMLQTAEVAAFSSYTDVLSRAYGSLLKDDLSDKNYNSASTTLNVELNDLVATALSELLKGEGLEYTPNDLKNLSLTADIATQNNLLQIALDLKDRLQIKSVVDMSNSVAYLAIPALNSTPVKAPIEIKNANTAVLNASPEELISLVLVDRGINREVANLIADAFCDETLRNALPTEAEFDAMLDRMVKAAFTAITEVEKETETVVVSGNSQKQVVLTTIITQSIAQDMVKKALESVKTDATLKKLLNAVDDYFQRTQGQSFGLAGMAEGAITDLINSIKPGHSKDFILMKSYVDYEGNLMGRQMTIDGETLSYRSAVDDDVTYFECSLPDNTRFSGTLKKEGEKATTTIEIPVEGEKITLAITTEGKKITLRATPNSTLTKELLRELDVDLPVIPGDLSLEVGLDLSKADQPQVSVQVLFANTPYIAVKISTALSHQEGAVSLPTDAVSTENSIEYYSWIVEASTNLPSLLKKLGLSDALIQQLVAGGATSLL